MMHTVVHAKWGMPNINFMWHDIAKPDLTSNHCIQAVSTEPTPYPAASLAFKTVWRNVFLYSSLNFRLLQKRRIPFLENTPSSSSYATKWSLQGGAWYCAPELANITRLMSYQAPVGSKWQIKPAFSWLSALYRKHYSSPLWGFLT